MRKLVLWSSCVVSKTLENVSDRKFLRKLWIPGQEIKQNFEHGYPYFCLILVVLLVWLPWLVGCKCLWAFHRFEEWLWLSWQCPWCHAHVRLWKQTHQHLDMILAPLGSFWRRNASRPKICHELVPQLVCSTSGKICTKPWGCKPWFPARFPIDQSIELVVEALSQDPKSLVVPSDGVTTRNLSFVNPAFTPRFLFDFWGLRACGIKGLLFAAVFYWCYAATCSGVGWGGVPRLSCRLLPSLASYRHWPSNLDRHPGCLPRTWSGRPRQKFEAGDLWGGRTFTPRLTVLGARGLPEFQWTAAARDVEPTFGHQWISLRPHVLTKGRESVDLRRIWRK